MDNPPRLPYCPRLGATLEAERSALAAVYRMILDDHEQKAGANTGDDARAEKEGGPEAAPDNDGPESQEESASDCIIL